MNKKTFSFKITSILLGVFIGLCVAEMWIRMNPHLYSEGYRPHKNEKIVYELQPRYFIHSLNAKINNQGLHDRYYSLSKPTGVFRIVVVGDSNPFGWIVGLDNSFPKVLE